MQISIRKIRKKEEKSAETVHGKFCYSYTLCVCASAEIILGSDGKITDQATFESEAGLIEKESDKDNQTCTESYFIDNQFLYDALRNPIAKYVFEINTKLRKMNRI